jgi:hypothetical protein
VAGDQSGKLLKITEKRFLEKNVTVVYSVICKKTFVDTMSSFNKTNSPIKKGDLIIINTQH